MNILICYPPQPLPASGSYNLPWSRMAGMIANQLARTSAVEGQPDYETRIAVAERHAETLRQSFPSLQAEQIIEISEKSILEVVHNGSSGLQDIAENLLTPGHPEEAALPSLIRDTQRQMAPEFSPQIVLCIGLPMYGLRQQFPDALVLFVETTAFSRGAFRFSCYFDPHGMFKHTSIDLAIDAAKQGQLKSPEAWMAQIRDLRDRSFEITAAAGREAQLLPARKRPRILFPLQASLHPSHDVVAGRQTVFEALYEMAGKISADMDLVVTEHPLASAGGLALDRAEREQLRKMFPNIEFAPRAVAFSSGSQLLLPQVDAVWAISSNILQSASFWGLPIGTPKESHLAELANCHDPEALCSMVRESASDQVPSAWREDLFAWMFQHHVTPVDPTSHALSNTLQARYSAFLDKAEGLAALGEAAPAIPEMHLVPQAERAGLGKPGILPLSPIQRSVRQKLLSQFSAVGQTRRQQFIRMLAAETSKTKRRSADTPVRSALLINHTAALEQFNHLGCTLNSTEIVSQLGKRGIVVDAVLNDDTHFRKHKDKKFDLVVLNGEGSIHHNRPRSKALLKWLDHFAATGSKTALINTIWQENEPELAQLLSRVDYVSCRDRRSQAELTRANITAALAPDLSLLAFDRESPVKAEGSRRGWLVTDCVVDRPELVDLHDLAVEYDFDMAFMDRRNVDALLKRGAYSTLAELRNRNHYVLNLAEEQGFSAAVLDQRHLDALMERGDYSSISEPRSRNDFVLNSLDDISAANGVITGRFHICMMALWAGTPFVSSPSNSWKIEALLEDIGLLDLCYVDSDAIRNDPFAPARKLLSWRASDIKTYRQAASAFVEGGQRAIADMFDTVAALVDHETDSD